MAAEKTYNDLDVSLRKANEHRNAWFEGVRKCTVNETLFTIMERIVRAEVHRLVITDDDSKVIGIISLSDILLFLVLRPSETSVSASTHNISLRSTELFNSAYAPTDERTTPADGNVTENIESTRGKVGTDGEEVTDQDDNGPVDISDLSGASADDQSRNTVNDLPFIEEAAADEANVSSSTNDDTFSSAVDKDD